MITCFVFFVAACKIGLKRQESSAARSGYSWSKYYSHQITAMWHTYEQNEVCSVGFEVSHLFLKNGHGIRGFCIQNLNGEISV